MGFFDLFRPGKWLAPIDDGKATGLSAAEDIAFGRNEPPLTRDLMLRFGGRGFLFNLWMWEAATRNGPACRYVPPDDYYRKRFETLAGTGVALRGAHVSLEMKLRALPLPTLREAAKELEAGTLRSKASGAALIAACAGAEAWLAVCFSADDFFLLQPEPWSYQDLESLWRTCEQEARAKMAQATADDD